VSLFLSFNPLAFLKLRVEKFDKVATWTKWGAITLIILVGAVLLLVAAIYQIIAFANLPEELEPRGKAISSPIA